MHVLPYLFFNGRTEEAFEYYKNNLGAEMGELMRFSECPEPGGGCAEGTAPPPPDKVMHMMFRIGNSEILASDGMCTGEPVDCKGFSLTIVADSDEDAIRMFNALAPEGTIQMPIGPTFYASQFGMVADKFGVSWMMIVEPKE